MALISWENDLLSSSPAVPGIARAVLATMSAPRHGLVEPLIECKSRDFQTIPLGRSVQSSPLLIAGFPGPFPCDLRASLVFLVSTHWYYTGTRFRGQLPRTPPPPSPGFASWLLTWRTALSFCGLHGLPAFPFLDSNLRGFWK